MAAAKPKKKGTQRHRIHNGEQVTPCKYHGKYAGHGVYLAAMVNGNFVVDENGKPLQFRDCPLES